MLTLPWVLFYGATLLLLISVYYNYKFATTIIRVEDAIELSLDELDSRYATISQVLEMPIFFDSPQVRQVIEDIAASRDAVLYVANQLTKVEVDGEEKADT